MSQRFFGLALFALLICQISAAPAVSSMRTPDGGIQPQAAFDEKGVLHLLYFKGDPAGGDLFYVKQAPKTDRFSAPIRVNSQPGSAMALGSIRGAQIALGKGGRVHVAWNGMGKGGTRTKRGDDEEAPLFYTRLNDSGTGFEPERNVIGEAYGLDGGSTLAADGKGCVYVFWHAPKPGNTNGEAGRAVFFVRSEDEGKTFAPERLATTVPTGACGCCGMRSFADSHGNVYALYRAASNGVDRAETLLLSRKGGEFEIAYSHLWKIASCPMSSANMTESGGSLLAAAETHGRVFFMSYDPTAGKATAPVSPKNKAKHPAIAANSAGEILLVWTEGTGWAKGGSVAWQLFSQGGEPIGEGGRAEGVPAWSLVSAVAKGDGGFLVIY